MYVKVEKPKENKSRAVANSDSKKKRNVQQGFGLADNRPVVIVQKKYQEKMNWSNSIQKQLDSETATKKDTEDLIDNSSTNNHCSDHVLKMKKNYNSNVSDLLDHNRVAPIQCMTLLPFTSADDGLNNFVDSNAQGLAGNVVKGTPTAKIGKNEKLALVGHGNGFELYSHFAGSKDLVKMNYNEVANFLAKYVLPDGYRGEIVVWSCNSATPWKHIPEIKSQIKDEDDERLDGSFITLLKQKLLDKTDLDLSPTIRGAIGFASLDKPWKQAEVYLDKDLKNIGPKKNFLEGFISTDQSPPGNWYNALDDDDDDAFEPVESPDEILEEFEDGLQENVPKNLEQEEVIDDDDVVITQRPLSELYPNFNVLTANPQTAGARFLRELGDIIIPSNTPVQEMEYLAVAIRSERMLIAYNHRIEQI